VRRSDADAEFGTIAHHHAFATAKPYADRYTVAYAVAYSYCRKQLADANSYAHLLYWHLRDTDARPG
jgi:hypothetical protein